jgi:hypothetical protein
MGTTFVVSYDLLQPGRDYGPLWTELQRLGGKRILLSQWALTVTNVNAAQFREHLRRFVDPNDRILVMSRDSSDWAGLNLLARVDQI